MKFDIEFANSKAAVLFKVQTTITDQIEINQMCGRPVGSG